MQYVTLDYAIPVKGESDKLHECTAVQILVHSHVLGGLIGMTAEEISGLEEAEIIGTKPQGWACSMEADEAISKLKERHGKDT